MTPRLAEAIVLGAGLSGAALACQLARRGYGSVLLADPATPAAGATGRAAGIVTEQLWDRWDVEVVRESMAEYAALSARGEPSAYRVNGFLRWTARIEVARVLASTEERLRRWGVELRGPSGSEVSRSLPWVRADDIVAASFAPRDAVVAPSRMAELYVEEARAHGVELELGAAFAAPRRESGRWSLEVGDRTWRAPTLVVAAGAWSKRLLASLGAPLPLVPYRTQAALVRPAVRPPGDFPSFHDIDLDVYARPEEAGRVLVGDGTDLVEADPERFVAGGDERFLTHVAEAFESRLPGWKDSDLVRAWAGVCVATPDRHPLVGPVPGAEGLYAITGFNGFGVMRAAGAASRLAETILDPTRAGALLGPVLPSRVPRPFPAFLPKPGFTLEGGSDPRF